MVPESRSFLEHRLVSGIRIPTPRFEAPLSAGSKRHEWNRNCGLRRWLPNINGDRGSSL